jgi:CRP/FNR family cyclic AMP-dependent transcriptional regulator
MTKKAPAMARFILDPEILRRLPPFSWFSAPQLTSALPAIHHHSYPRRARVQRGGDGSDGLYIVLSGSFNIVHESGEGHELLVSTIRAGAFFGELGLFDDEICTASIYAAEPSEVLFILRNVVLQSLQENAKASMCMLGSIMARLCETHRKLAHLTLTTVDQRVAAALLEHSVSAGDEWHVQIGSESIAARIAASREMVSRVLRGFIERGVVARRGRKLFIIDRDALAQVVETRRRTPVRGRTRLAQSIRGSRQALGL